MNLPLHLQRLPASFLYRFTKVYRTGWTHHNDMFEKHVIFPYGSATARILDNVSPYTTHLDVRGDSFQFHETIDERYFLKLITKEGVRSWSAFTLEEPHLQNVWNHMLR